MPPPKPRCYELLIKQAADKLNITCIPNRLSILTQPLNGRPACHYCGQCGRGCATHSNFSSPSVLLPPALATGKLTHHHQRDGARSHSPTTAGLATRRLLRRQATDRRDYARPRADRRARGQRVRVGAAAAQLEVGDVPDGLANSSGMVGKYLTDSTGRRRRRPHPEDGAACRTTRTASAARTSTCRGGSTTRSSISRAAITSNSAAAVGAELRVHGRHPRFTGSRIGPAAVGGYGKSLKDDYRRFYGATVSFAGRGEMIPNDHTYCEIDPNVVDTYGIPVLRFHVKWSDHEINQAKHMQETFRAIIHEMGGTPMSPMPSRERGYGLAAGRAASSTRSASRGWATIRQTSVLNANCQAHDVKNLFVADGGPFVSSATRTAPGRSSRWRCAPAKFIADQRKTGTDLTPQCHAETQPPDHASSCCRQCP